MSTSLDIMNNMVTTIQGINGSPTYINTVRSDQVNLGDLHFELIPKNSFPHFNVVLNSEPREKEPQRLKKSLSVDVVCTFRKERDTPYETWLADIEKALAQDVRRGGLAIETWVSDIQRETQLAEEFQIYVMNVLCTCLVDFGSL